jgi:sulfate transport system permease protein
MKLQLKRRSILPGFGLTFGLTVTYLGLIVLIPLSGLFLRTTTMSWSEFWETVVDPRALASYRLSFGASAAAAAINTLFGFIVAWVLVRYRFPGRKLLDAMVDLPFALPTAVSGIALTTLYASNGWIGRWLEPLGLKISYTPLGVVVVLTFVGLPFVVRALQPALEDLETALEEAAASLGASRWQTFNRVILPPILPVVLAGYAMAFARALGEYGSVIFISGNIRMQTEIAPFLIFVKLEQYKYSAATAIAVVILVAAFLILLVINLLQRWGRRWHLQGT